MKTKLPTRRATLVTLSVSAAGAMLPGCSVREPPESDPTPGANDDDDVTPVLDCEETGHQTEGPYYPGEPDAIVDITDGRSGLPLQVELRVVDVANDCASVEGAEVDLWHADASGDYSGYEDFDTVGEDWLRGQQVTDADGIVRFQSIFPGSYPGRSVHLHVKVRATGFDELTTQVYFPDTLAEAVLARADYDGASMTPIDEDNFYSPETMTDASGDASDGVSATIVLGLA